MNSLCSKFKVQHLCMLFLLVNCHVSVKAQSEISNFRSGHTKVFQSDGLGKSKGLKFQLKYPDNWTERDGERPNIVKMFSAPDYEIQASVYIYKLKVQPSDDEKELILSSDGIQYLLSNDAYEPEILQITPNQFIDGEKVTSAVYKTMIKRLDLTAQNKSLSYLMIYKDYQIMLSFGVTSLDKEKNIDKIYMEYEPLFKLIASSFVLISKYEQTNSL